MSARDQLRRWSWLAVPLIIALAAANFLWQLGSSSYFVDELLSIGAAAQPLGRVLHAVGRTEIAPPAYFFMLHGWLQALGGSRLEWATRLASAICGELLVAAVYWLASLLTARRAAALFAAALAALSPFVLQYAQLAQGYVFVALMATAAVAAAVQADRLVSGCGQRACLALAILGAVLALVIHYTALFAIAPLCVWVLRRPSITRVWRFGMAASCLLVELALVPLLSTQHQAFPARSGVAGSGALTANTLSYMLEVPFAGRVAPVRALGIAVTVCALLVLLLRARDFLGERTLGPARRLLLVIAVGEPLALVLMSAVGGSSFWGHLMLPRYAAVAVPFIVVAIALACAELPRVLGGALGCAAVAAALVGVFGSHRPAGFYLDGRGAAQYLRSHARAGDAVIIPADTTASLPLRYYGLGPLRPYANGSPAATRVMEAGRRRVWVVFELPPQNTPSSAALLSAERQTARSCGYRVLDARVFTARTPLGVLGEAPLASRARCA
jgi:4-amino-4-deoxy-L-arabinose transferase-like glycosyltransferase